MPKLIFLVCIFLNPARLFAQCGVTEKILPDGTMYYHAETLLFFKTGSFQLAGNVVTDKENYFLNLRPSPFPEKPKGTKLKKSIDIVLSNDSTYTLPVFDAFYRDEDTSFSILFRFDRKNMESFRNNEVKEVKLDLGDGSNTYVFKLHKDALRQQLACFMKPKNKL